MNLDGWKRERDGSPRRDGSRRRRKKRRSRGRDGSASTDSSPSEKGLFRAGSSLSGGSRSRIQRIADDQPGELCSQAVGDINGFLGARGAASRGAKSSESWTIHLQAVPFAQHLPSSLPPEKVRELEVGAKASGRLESGALKGAADQQTQALKALEPERAGRQGLGSPWPPGIGEHKSRAMERKLGRGCCPERLRSPLRAPAIVLPRRYQLPRPLGQLANDKRLGFKERRLAERRAAKEDYRTTAAATPPATGGYRDGRRSPTPPVRPRVALREAPAARCYCPERLVDEAVGGRSTRPPLRRKLLPPRRHEKFLAFKERRRDRKQAEHPVHCVPVEVAAGGRSTSPSRREAVAAPAAEKGFAMGASKGQKGGRQKGPAEGQKSQRGSRGSKLRRVHALRKAGYFAVALKKAGYSAADLRSAYAIVELRDSGYTDAEILRGRFSAGALREAGYTAADLWRTGYSAAAVVEAGYAFPTLVEAGYGTLTRQLRHYGTKVIWSSGGSQKGPARGQRGWEGGRGSKDGQDGKTRQG